MDTVRAEETIQMDRETNIIQAVIMARIKIMDKIAIPARISTMAQTTVRTMIHNTAQTVTTVQVPTMVIQTTMSKFGLHWGQRSIAFHLT